VNSGNVTERKIGLLGATGVGVGAIVGGGILALAGVAFATTGPAAMLAFGLNGVIALLTALSFAEMSSKFPESGGTYTFSKKVLSIEAAFMVGWTVWFASIVAAALYAVGFAYFTLVMAADVWHTVQGNAPEWFDNSRLVTGVAVATTVLLAIGLMLKPAGGGQWGNVGKVLVFAILIFGGLWALVRQPAGETVAALQPFFTAGFGGLIQAMGYTFIALQGFDLIAAVGGEVREPSKTLPRAMVLSLAIALIIYLPLLFVITTVGTPVGQTIAAAAADNPEGIVAIAARQFLGPAGYWLVIVAAVLSMFTALQANLFAASRIAWAMAQDRTLPARFGVLHSKYGTPAAAAAATAVLVAVLLLLLPDVSAAGAAASLIFLVTFALAHWIAILVRQRSVRRPPPFRSPLFPVVPILGGLACVGLAVFQGIAVPTAGKITIVWLAIGGILFLGLFARRARVMDVASTAFDPELMTLRGRSPLVLVPVANPRNAEAMITLADALVPGYIGRVLMQSIAVAPANWQPDADPSPIDKSQAVLRELVRASVSTGIRVETLMTVAAQPMEEIARVARLHRCDSVLLGLTEISENNQGTQLESLLSALDANVAVLRSREEWRLSDVKKILVPIAGRGGHEYLRAQLLGSLLRSVPRELTFLRVLPGSATADEVRHAQRELRRLAADEIRQRCNVEVIQSDDALQTVAQKAEEADLLILGVQRLGRRKKLFGEFTRQLARRTSCPLIVMSRRG
jgi:amino acid transporter/nucleotide-binding universal stress UspA family protein